LVSTDGTRKWLVQPPNGGTSAVEMVYIPDAGAEDEDDVDMDRAPRTASRSPRASRVPARHLAGASVEDVLAGRAGGVHKRRRATLCVSSQAGCSLACTFCHTGTQALSRNLSAADIVSQVWLARRRVREMQEREPALPHLSNIVFMGQGEPGFNWRAVSTAIQILTDARGFGMSPRRITVSTAGVAPIIPRIARETPGVRLAISLHAPTDELRSRIMNVNTMYPIATLMAACREYVQIRLAAVQEAKGGAVPALDSDAVPQLAHERVSDAHNSARRVRITFEYVMLAGVNDTPGHALELSKLLLAHLPRSAVHINLIAFNAWPGSEYRGSSPDVIARFQGALYRSGLRAHIRRSRGGDILGACGQLKSAAESKAAASRRASTVSKPAPEA
ncbi:23S rRNA (adenine(2503)-C(2))-methyltransferase RlmN, partial [archaeon]